MAADLDDDEQLLQAAVQADSDGNTPSTNKTASPNKPKQNDTPTEDPALHEQRLNKLKFLLQRSGVYSQIMGEKMEKERKQRALAASKQATKSKNDGDDNNDDKSALQENKPPSSTTSCSPRKTRASANGATPKENGTAPSTRKRKQQQQSQSKSYDVSNYIDEADIAEAQESAKRQKTEKDANGEEDHARRSQPALVTGATMKEYQLDGLEWLVSLYENGLNGILADEMGLGKTLQTISFLAHLREKGVWGPFLIVAPLSTIHNWITEFARFTPDIPTIMYHGTADERKRIRSTHLRPPTIRSERQLFPVVVTSYEMIVRDRGALAVHAWKFIVVDEGHRLKNLNCRLIRELKTFKSANRLILTGTPLHNNLAELWSLLNFILPDIFDDLATFEAWFDFSDIHDEETAKAGGILSKQNSAAIITQLHEILKPFLLRRLKSDVERNLPPKKEYLLYAPLTPLQKDLYTSVVNHDIRRWLMERKTGLEYNEIQEILDNPDGEDTASTPSSGKTQIRIPSGKKGAGRSAASSPGPGSGTSTPRRSVRRGRRKSIDYNVDEEADSSYFERLEEEQDRAATPLTPAQAERQGKLYSIREAQKQINNMHLENVVMQARKICNHPFLFDWPIDPDTGSFIVNKDLINASGKMLMLNRLLDALFARGHKVLIFSQFTTMLDIIQDWAHEYKEIRTCRIDGSTKQEERREQMHAFNTETGPDSCNLFLLSTRAGGLGINLIAADTVIFYDSDWNPQMDLQAQDRVHRIGQTKPCLIFRLVSANTVEQRILKRAGNKRKLEALVIQSGKFRLPAGYNSSRRKREKEDDVAALASELLRLEGETVVTGENDEVISDANLDKLLDRSEAAYARRTGWVTSVEGSSNAAFEVTETVADEANEEIAKLLAGES